ncbi:MAG: hypothetical protein CL946_06095 [Ectothiorhodospiraceae bacterium]|nr:hypothetical protein [Ectothiorhodospiraceae bacterium]
MSEQQIIWITGASSGIGKATALKLAMSGDTVLISSRNEEALEKVKQEAGDNAGRIHPYPCDVSDAESVKRTTDAIFASHGQVDILINNAGTTVFKSFEDSTIDDLDALYGVNLRGAFLCTKAVLPSMLERRDGMIVMVNSMAAKAQFKDSSVYAATKAGLMMMTEDLRFEVQKKGVRVISVYPGATATNIWPEKMLEKFGERMMKPETIADSIIHAVKAPSEALVSEITIQPPTGGL